MRHFNKVITGRVGVWLDKPTRNPIEAAGVFRGVAAALMKGQLSSPAGRVTLIAGWRDRNRTGLAPQPLACEYPAFVVHCLVSEVPIPGGLPGEMLSINNHTWVAAGITPNGASPCMYLWSKLGLRPPNADVKLVSVRIARVDEVRPLRAKLTKA